MGSHGGASGGTQAQSHDPKSTMLAREGSFYGLTLDEVQNQLGDLGKPLTSMNLDELLKTLWTAESTQGMDVVPSLQHGQAAPVSSLQRQSSIALSRDLSKKTVDEVWKEIQNGQKSSNLEQRTQERHPTLGEMTLEDFLVKAGVVAESGPTRRDSGSAMGVELVSIPQQQAQARWANYPMTAARQSSQQQPNIMPVYMPGHPIQQPIPMGANPMMDVIYPESQMTMSPSALMGALSDTQTPGRKRGASGEVVEKSVERRQKRMIKNRESAARSRARKQAYTHELENKVSRLEEENERLKKQQELEKLLPSVPLPEPKYQLRRTSSGPI
ncbi:hypothetical protein Leryth_009641 [Lithospermum erythrorhizon]|nr:hypothetical protein Leryth_009641 [Lithospermum erythrorhizon]